MIWKCRILAVSYRSLSRQVHTLYNRRHRQRLNQYSRGASISNVSVILAGRPLREIHTPTRPFILTPFSISLYVASALGRLGPNGPLFRPPFSRSCLIKRASPWQITCWASPPPPVRCGTPWPFTKPPAAVSQTVKTLKNSIEIQEENI